MQQGEVVYAVFHSSLLTEIKTHNFVQVKQNKTKQNKKLLSTIYMVIMLVGQSPKINFIKSTQLVAIKSFCSAVYYSAITNTRSHVSMV